MSDKFENIFKERFSDFEMPPPTGSWGNIAAHIHKPYPFISVIRIITSALISAACLLLPITLDKNDFDNNSSWLSYVAINVNENNLENSNKNIAHVFSFDKSVSEKKNEINNNSENKHITELSSDKTFNEKKSKKSVYSNVEEQKEKTKVVVEKINDLVIANERSRNINSDKLNDNKFNGSENEIKKAIVLLDKKQEENSGKEKLDNRNNGNDFKGKVILNSIPEISLTKTNLLKTSEFNGLFNRVGLFGIPKEIVIVEKEKLPFFVSAQFRPHLTYGKTVSNTDDEKIVTGIKGAKRISKERMGYSLGFGVEKYFSKRVAVSLGVYMDHIKYHTQFDIRNIRPDNIQTLSGPNGMSINTLYEIKQESTLFKYNLYNTRIGIKYTLPKNVTNKYFRLTYGFSKLQKLSYTSKTENVPVNIDDFGGEINSLIQFSYGMEHMINNKIRLNLEPTFSYYFNDLSTNGYHFSLKPYNLGINFGIAYKFR